MRLSLGAPAVVIPPLRTLLRAPTTLAVDSTAGNDATGGLASPFATPAGAYAWAGGNLDLGFQQLTIEMTGTFNGLSQWYDGPLVGQTGLVNIGGTATVNGPAGGYIFQTRNRAFVQVLDLTLIPGAGGGALLGENFSLIQGDRLKFSLRNHPHSLMDVVTIGALAGFTIIDGGTTDFVAIVEDNSNLFLSGPATLIGTPNWASAFCQGDLGGLVDATGFSYSGSATGTRYAGNVFWGGAGGIPPTYFPGSP